MVERTNNNNLWGGGGTQLRHKYCVSTVRYIQSKIKKFLAFTLAEVLITLGVIGIVAAMTIPALITKRNEIITAQKLKKTYAMLQNATRLSVADNGDSDGWEFNDQSDAETFWSTYYAPYLKNTTFISAGRVSNYKIKNYKGDEFWAHVNNWTLLPDGSCIRHYINNQFYFLIYDINCSAPPNTLGKDVWDIAELYWFPLTGRVYSEFASDGERPQIPFLNNLKKDSSLRSQYAEECKSATYNGGRPTTCFAVFVADGWKFSKDLHW